MAAYGEYSLAADKEFSWHDRLASRSGSAVLRQNSAVNGQSDFPVGGQ